VTRLRVEEKLAEASAAAAAKAEAELAKVRADTVAQLEAATGALAEVKAELKAEVAAVKRESAAQLQRLQQAEVAQGLVALSLCANARRSSTSYQIRQHIRCLYI
jgi:hypothetical protein